MVQDIGQKVVYPVWRGAVRALMAPEELLPCIAGQHFHHKLRREGLSPAPHSFLCPLEAAHSNHNIGPEIWAV